MRTSSRYDLSFRTPPWHVHPLLGECCNDDVAYLGGFGSALLFGSLLWARPRTHCQGNGCVCVWYARLGSKLDLPLLPSLEVFIYLCRSQVVAGKPLLVRIVEVTVIFRCRVRDYRPSQPVHPEMSDRMWDMIQRCWHMDPSNGMPTAAEVVTDVLEAEL